MWYLLLSSLFLARWKEASGVDAACGSCESGGFPASGTSSGSSLSNPGRKNRDVSESESMLYKNELFEVFDISLQTFIRVDVLLSLP